MGTNMTAPTLTEQIAELKREIALRKNVYPKWVASGRMKQAEADRALARMSAACSTLEWLEKVDGSGEWRAVISFINRVDRPPGCATTITVAAQVA